MTGRKTPSYLLTSCGRRAALNYRQLQKAWEDSKVANQNIDDILARDIHPIAAAGTSDAKWMAPATAVGRVEQVYHGFFYEKQRTVLGIGRVSSMHAWSVDERSMGNR